MSGLVEKEPCLARILDPKNSRSLLDDVYPLEASVTGGKSTTVAVKLVNSDEGPIDLKISADQPWAEPKQKEISLMGGETGECQIVVQGTSAGPGEFANVCFTLKSETQTYKEYILLWRKISAARPVDGIHPLPDWMRQS